MEKIFVRETQGATLGGIIGTAIGSILAASATIVLAPVSVPVLCLAAAGTAAAVSLVYGLKKWAADETSQEIKFTTGGKNGVCISKTEDGKYIVDTKYDWASDPAFADVAEDDGIIIDISGKDDGTACCDDELDEETEEEDCSDCEEPQE